MIKVIFTDLDGVIRFWNTSKLNQKERQFALPVDSVFKVCFEKALLEKVITGKITDAEWRQRVKVLLAKKIGNTQANLLVDEWTQSPAKIDRSVVQRYKTYFPEAKIVLITNATDRLEVDLKNQGLSGIFDGIVNSSALKTAKPGVSIFSQARVLYQVSPSECLFIDDSEANVIVARNSGMSSHWYKSVEQLKDFLQEMKG